MCGQSHPKTDHLPKIKPGEVRNPKGYSRKRRLTDALIKKFEDEVFNDEFIMAGINEALKGNFLFWKHVFDCIDGPIPEQIGLKHEVSDETRPRIEVPDVDQRPKRRANRRKAKTPGSNGDVSP